MRAAWARCPRDQRLHLLTPTAVLQLAVQGCALAYCGVLLTTQDLILRGRGTPCLMCLVREAAS